MKKWRKLEVLVEKIERTLSPTSAIIKSPDYLIDKTTGGSREVDVSIRYTVGSSQILIAIECRDRSTKQDVRWIEEIKTKHDNLGTAKIIAVASKGFTKQAIEKAQFFNIELRTFDEITEVIITEWNKYFVVEVVTLKYHLESAKYILDGKHENTKLLDSEEKDILKTPMVTIKDIIYTLERFIDFKKVHELVKSHAGKKLVIFSAKFKEDAFAMTNQGLIRVKEILVSLTAWEEKTPLYTDNITRYRDITTNQVHEMVYYDLKQVSDENIGIEVYKNLKEG